MKEFKVGDEVIKHSNRGDPVAVKRVVEVKKLYLELNDGTKWAQDGGTYPKKDRDTWHNTNITHVTDKKREQIRRRCLIYNLKEQWNPEDFATSSLDRIWTEVCGAVKHGED